jgi:hypothetical protein
VECVLSGKKNIYVFLGIFLIIGRLLILLLTNLFLWVIISVEKKTHYFLLKKYF